MLYETDEEGCWQVWPIVAVWQVRGRQRDDQQCTASRGPAFEHRLMDGPLESVPARQNCRQAVAELGGDRCPTLDETLQTFTETHKIGIRWKVAPNRLPTPTDPPNPVSEAASLLNI